MTISHRFHHELDPAVCVYECPYKVFGRCQYIPKLLYAEDIGLVEDKYRSPEVNEVEPEVDWLEVRDGQNKLKIIDVRQLREYQRGYIPGAGLVPLPQILPGRYELKPTASIPAARGAKARSPGTSVWNQALRS